LDLTTGSPAWSSKVGTTSAYVGAIEYRSGTLYTDQGVVDASNGRKLWNWPNGFSVDRITFSGRYVIAATVSGQVGSFDAKSGLVHWQSRRPRNSKLGGGVAGQEGVFVVTYDDYQDEAHNGSLVALNRQDGSVRWRLPLLSKNQPLLSEPLALSGGKLYLLRPHKTGTGDDIVALDARTGHSLWTYPSGRGLTGPPVVQQGLIYVSAAGENWLALNENHGRPVWSFTPPGRQVAAPSERGRK
jgi:outer membrane protein assembly factor BamB